MRYAKAAVAGLIGTVVALGIHETMYTIINADLLGAALATFAVLFYIHYKFGMKYSLFACTIGSFAAGLMLSLLGAEMVATHLKLIPICMLGGIWFATLAFRKFSVKESGAGSRAEAELEEMHPDERAKVLAERQQSAGERLHAMSIEDLTDLVDRNVNSTPYVSNHAWLRTNWHGLSLKQKQEWVAIRRAGLEPLLGRADNGVQVVEALVEGDRAFQRKGA